MRNQESKPQIALVRPISDDDVLGIAGDSPVLIEASQVDAVCRSIKRVYFGPYKQEKLVFEFTAITPEQYSGQVLQMFVRVDPRWKTPPSAAKLYKAACVAQGRHLQKGERIDKTMFLNHVFRCRLTRTGQGAAAYTI